MRFTRLDQPHPSPARGEILRDYLFGYSLPHLFLLPKKKNLLGLLLNRCKRFSQTNRGLAAKARMIQLPWRRRPGEAARYYRARFVP
jgi:hypothetical protein